MASTKEYFATAASLAASVILLRTVINNFLPADLRRLIWSLISEVISKLRSRLSNTRTIIIENHHGLNYNEIFDAAMNYLGNKIPQTVRRLRVSKNKNDNHIEITIADGEVQTDTFEGAQFRWRLHTKLQNQSKDHDNGHRSAKKIQWFELTCNGKHEDIAERSYLNHILDESKVIKAAAKTLRLYINNQNHWIPKKFENHWIPMEFENHWTPTKFQHPMTFDTLAMETELRQMVEEDLTRFMKRKEYYKRIGKAWKRGYLLHGPPGTGKTSLIAAMANYLRYDIYYLDLKEVRSNNTLQILLLHTSNKSMLVIEDIDSSIVMQKREEEVEVKTSSRMTLSGLLNFIDGLWSTSGEERIIVFTTNHKDRLDPALIRPGRMDVHIHMGYCSPSSFRVLASNYHGIDEHPLFREIEELLGKVEATPAEIAEELTRRTDADEAIDSIIKLLHRKRKTSE
ncbi:hypothetical protein HPP92_005778 [Vanilla planifolia]|uniref:AAA+ ATPase domain-containing protein n=1 Tax=Vanilla planifolia TaxID=51239 RepID=A0A835VBP7_VANPL|nr:hypothetical protein HPP92_005778 [Vanilla planifolia]